MEQKTIPLGQGSARVWTAGEGEAIVLLHGPWAGAEAYWFKVADELARKRRVVAPELPGIGMPGAVLPTFGAYAAWLDELLGGLGIDRATVVGNSLGASIAWRYASQYPDRCRSLVMVNGYPPPVYHRAMRWLVSKTSVRRMVRTNFLRNVYGSAALGLAFHDRNNAPMAIVKALDHFSPAEIDAMLELLLADEPVLPPPTMRTLLLFGEADKLPPFDKRGARQMRSALADNRLVTIKAAGHMPQVEHPVAFLRALREFAG